MRRGPSADTTSAFRLEPQYRHFKARDCTQGAAPETKARGAMERNVEYRFVYAALEERMEASRRRDKRRRRVFRNGACIANEPIHGPKKITGVERCFK